MTAGGKKSPDNNCSSFQREFLFVKTLLHFLPNAPKIYYDGNRTVIMWLRVLEVWLTARLLASPTFHRAVRTVHKKVHEVRNGKDPAEMGGTNIDQPRDSDVKKFFQYYLEELRDQFRNRTFRK